MVALISKSSRPVNPRSARRTSEVLACRQALLSVEVATGGRELEGAAVGAEPEIGIALGQVGPGAGEPASQADAAPLDILERARDGPGEIETEASAACERAEA